MKTDGYRCVMKLMRSEVEYDVDYTSWKIAQCRITEDVVQRAEAQTDKENYNWLTRKVESAVNEVKRLLSAYVDEYPHRMQKNELDSKEEFLVILQMECGWRGDVRRMNMFFHNYVVDYVLSEWFRMVMPNEATGYSVSADNWLSNLMNEAKSVDVGPIMFRL